MTIADINAEIRALCDADSTSLTDATLLRRVNGALETLVGKIVNADGSWQFDDTNYSDMPRGTGNLLEGQQQYSFAGEYLQVEAVDILTTTAGLYTRIKQLDPDDLDGMSPEQYFGVTSGNANKGFPNYYDIQGDSIRLFPAPTSTYVTLTAGIRVWFKRTAQLYTSAEVTSGTKEPGIASPYHMLICYMAALPYCMGYKKDRVALYQKYVDDQTKDLLKFYGRRNKDHRDIMTPRLEEYV